MTLRYSPSLAVAVLAACAATVPVEAQRAEPLPADLEGVDITEHLDRQLPLELTFDDEQGREVALREYFREGRPVMFVLGYYECPMLCSLVLNGLLEVLGQIDWVPGEQFEIVNVSIDPEETPKLAAFKKQNYLEAYGEPAAADGWHFLTGGQTEIETLADALGFGYEFVEARNEYAHGAVLILATPDGRISRYIYGVSYDPRTVRLSLVEASQGKLGNTLDRILLYCYHYDATAGRYAPVAMNIMRLGGAVTLALLGSFLVWLWARDRRRKGIA